MNEQRFVLEVFAHTDSMGEVSETTCIETEDLEAFVEAIFEKLEDAVSARQHADHCRQRLHETLGEDRARRKELVASGPGKVAMQEYQRAMSDDLVLTYPNLVVQGRFLTAIAEALETEEDGVVMLAKLDEWFEYSRKTSFLMATRNFPDRDPHPGIDLRKAWQKRQAASPAP
ncbi:hypothetical protein [Salipiger mucosus]|uniref:Uncharacterized protein n=1 Tax=Salipiger mucosus DSM 16094 TaxID=1123237 RepID=S9Q5U3_9RHOB|nr:hypothetical protein [Salipiger mucosus]EPX76746.1 hypothetical protein Salmuc_04631 [Salipiger mucosus DSM 16094]